MAAGLPSAVLVEIEFTAGVWTDVGSLVKGDSIEIHVGRDSAASGIQPGTLDLDLDNADGRFTPDNPTSTHYPNFVEGKRIRVRVTKSATTYVRFVGRITSLEPSFPTGEPTQSVTHVEAVDALGMMQRVQFTGSLLKSIVAKGGVALYNPDIAFFALDDANGSQGAIDLTGRAVPMVEVATASTGSVEWGSTTGLDPDDTGFAALKTGRSIRHAAPAFSFPTGSSTTAITFFAFITEGEYGEVLSLSVGKRGGARNYLSVTYLSTGLEAFEVVDGVGSAVGGGVDVQSGWNCISVRYISGDTELYVNGVLLSTTPATQTRAYSCLSIGGDADFSVAYVAMGAIVDSGVPLRTVRGQTSVDAFTVDLLLDYIDLAAGATDVGVASEFDGAAVDGRYATSVATAGRSALDAYVDVANSAAGVMYHAYSTSATQSLTILTRAASRPTTVALTLDAEADLNGAPSLVREANGQAAAATVRSQNAELSVADGTLASLVGGATVERDIVLYDPVELYVVATDLLAQGVNLRTRLTSLTVDLATASNDLYASFYDVTPGERLRLSGLPTTYFGVSYIDGYVEGWTERPGVNGYGVVFDLSPADAPTEARYDTGRYAFGDGVCTVTGGTAVGTTATGTITLTWATSPTLSTAAGDYPMDFDWNGERVTVTSAPAGGTSPRTLTITARGVAPTVARSHSAGESIEPWDAARYAL